MRLNINKLTLTIILLITFTLVKGESGNTVFGFLDIPVSSRINALGGVNISVVERDLSITSQNPALLGPEMDKNVSLSYLRYIKDVNLGSCSYAIALNDNGAIAFGAQFLIYGSVQRNSDYNHVLYCFFASFMLF